MASEEPTSFFSIENLKVASVNIFCGTLNGYSIGFVGVYTTLQGFRTNCQKYTAKVACNTLKGDLCAWSAYTLNNGTSVPYCAVRGEDTACLQFTEESSCINGNDKCQWSYSDTKCENKYDYDALNSGIFAGAMIVGCMFGSMFAGPIAKKLGPKVCFIVVGTIATVCSILYHISTAYDIFWLLCPARLVIGLVLGLVCVAAPMYVAENAAPKYCKMIGVLFQVFTTFGIFLAATVGLAVGQTVKFDKDKKQYLNARQQGLCAASTFLSCLVILLGFYLGQKKHHDEEEEKAEELDSNEYGWFQMFPRLIMGTVVAGTLQLTGINAVMNYAPDIMGRLGLSPLVGNFVVMVWNFVTTFVSIPLASFMTMRQMFLMCSAVTSISCLFLCGIPVYPGVAANNVRNGVAITGILIFIAFFEIGVGPCFYVLAQDMFPPSFRPKGSSWTMLSQFIFNVIINVCYPIATQSFSGGPSGDQNKGQAIAFIAFGCIGIACFILQWFFLHPWDEAHKSDVADKEPIAEDKEAANELAEEEILEAEIEADEADPEAAEDTLNE